MAPRNPIFDGKDMKCVAFMTFYRPKRYVTDLSQRTKKSQDTSTWLVKTLVACIYIFLVFLSNMSSGPQSSFEHVRLL